MPHGLIQLTHGPSQLNGIITPKDSGSMVNINILETRCHVLGKNVMMDQYFLGPIPNRETTFPLTDGGYTELKHSLSPYSWGRNPAHTTNLIFDEFDVQLC